MRLNSPGCYRQAVKRTHRRFSILPVLLLLSASACRQVEVPALIHADVAQAAHAMIATQEPHATQIGIDILSQGGNAADAAVAIALTLAVTYPQAGNLGGGGFLLYRDAEGALFALDFRETAPAGLTPDLLLDETGRPLPRISIRGGLAVGTPGTVAGLAEAHRLWGSRPWKSLIDPAERLAREGFRLSERDARLFTSSGEHLLESAESRRIFAPQGHFPAAGDRLTQPDLATTLQKIRVHGPDGFYTGSVAAALVESVRRAGGVLTKEDLKEYKTVLRTPLTFPAADRTFVSFPLPSSGGITIAQILAMTEGHRNGQDAETLHRLIEAERRAFADRATWLGDPDRQTVPVARLLDRSYLDDRAAGLDRKEATRSENVQGGLRQAAESRDTIHFSIVSADGSAAALTYSLNGAFGTGITTAGTGILLNNSIDDFAVAPGVPNLYGLVGGEANAVHPGSRPLSSMTPMMVLDAEGRLDMVLGSPGGSKIITSILLTLIRHYDYGWSLEEAIEWPRWHHQWLPDFVQLERDALTEEIRLELENRGHRLKVADSMFGNITAIARENGLWVGVADGRRGGSAQGF